MNIIALQQYVTKLKEIKRKGWLLRGLDNVESVADHSYGVCFLTMILADKLKLNTEKCLKLALVHDLVETISTDITPHDNITQKEKNKLEKKAIQKISKECDAEFLIELFDEYEENITMESQLVKDVDKLEMAFQAKHYQEKNTNKDLDEFFTYVDKKIKLKEVRELFDELNEKD